MVVVQDLIAAMRKLHAYSGRTYVPFTFDCIRVKSYEGTMNVVLHHSACLVQSNHETRAHVCIGEKPQALNPVVESPSAESTPQPCAAST